MAHPAICAIDTVPSVALVDNPADLPPLTAEQAQVKQQLEILRTHLSHLETLPKRERWAGFHQDKEHAFEKARDLLRALSLIDHEATVEVDCQAVIAALEPEKIARLLDATTRPYLETTLEALKKPHAAAQPYGVSFGPMAIDLQFTQEAHMHTLIDEQVNAIERDTNDLEKLRKALAQLHALHKKDTGMNLSGEKPETVAKVKELLDAVYAIDPLIWKEGGYTFDEHSFQAIVENMNGKTQAISRLINAKYLTIEQKTQLRNLFNTCISDIMRKLLREIEKIMDNSNARR